MSSHIAAAPFPQGLDIVFLDGLVIKTVIGINEDEFYDPQPIRVNIAIGMPQNRACQTDKIEDTINFGAVRHAVKLLAVHHRFQLVESFTEAIAQLILNDLGAHWVRVWVAKTAIFKDIEGVGMVIERTRKVEPTNESGDGKSDH